MNSARVIAGGLVVSLRLTGAKRREWGNGGMG